ncbi:exported hypothetical protein [uncultured Desulfovibrio sp.]|uniref:Uncharacterized protein n=1 Tax=uncultured Desulfovibrio sp. TaxID=167968 RepID=A0A212JE59_9BACT|nr:exported hypothetical protein [uncultured Desulfovibrio sp.]
MRKRSRVALIGLRSGWFGAGPEILFYGGAMACAPAGLTVFGQGGHNWTRPHEVKERP